MPGSSIAQYRYDALGRRIEKDVDGAITRYVYDGEDILLEFDGTNTQIARYTHGFGIDEPLIMARGGQSLFYQTDGLGSIIDLTDINGAVVQSYVYNSFGNIEQQVGNVVNPYTYTGREIDTESGLYFYRARYYDSITGRFINEDPIGFAAGDNNFYRYVQGNPINWVDPWGLKKYPNDFIGPLQEDDYRASGIRQTICQVIPQAEKLAKEGLKYLLKKLPGKGLFGYTGFQVEASIELIKGAFEVEKIIDKNDKIHEDIIGFDVHPNYFDK